MAVDSDRVRDLARRYTSAWCSQDPAQVADHYTQAGSLTINGGEPAEGRAAITEVARSFMGAFPDMQVLMDDVVVGDGSDGGTVYHWTLVGTYGETGMQVRIPGYEEWTLGHDGLIAESQGHYDQAEYDRQLQYGVESG